MIDPDSIDFEKGNGLVPVVVQDAATLQVLTLAYMDRAALDETIQSGEATFFSRSRGGRWRKGETSGDFLNVVSVTPDCDGDAGVVKVRPVGNRSWISMQPTSISRSPVRGSKPVVSVSRTISRAMAS